MRLTTVRVRGYQSFGDSGDVNFADGINLIIGQNNSGKSAFLRALLPTLADDRHRTPEKWQQFNLREPEVTFTISASGDEIRNWTLRSGQQLNIPVSSPHDHNVTQFLHDFFRLPALQMRVTRTPNIGFQAPYPSHSLFGFTPGSQQFSATITPRNGDLVDQVDLSSEDTLPLLFMRAWEQDMFYFQAERMMVGESPVGHADRLQPNASNLPNVLHTLHNERGNLFQKLINHVRTIFSTVGNVSIRIRPENGQLEIRVWPTVDMERLELGFPLNSGGTGVAQVLAILTAVLTVDDAVIIIDEINSFLHPAAVKSLLRILQTEYQNNQYIVSTHSPEVIGFSNPSSVHLVRRQGYESTVECLGLTSVSEFREVAEHLGVSMADVFSAERVIWVEGATEELCFPFLFQQKGGILPAGTVITSVAATGDFIAKRRDARIVFEIYTRLSAAVATLPVSVIFSFDSEQLTEVEKATMQGNAKGRLRFLPRRHLECYLLNPSAIADFIVSKSPVTAATIDSRVVTEALQAAASVRPFLIPSWNGDLGNLDWLTNVDGAGLIVDVCDKLSDNCAPFTKKADSLFLIQKILQSDPAELSSLITYIMDLVQAVCES